VKTEAPISQPSVGDLRVGDIFSEGLSILPRVLARFFVLALLIKLLPLVYQLGVGPGFETTALGQDLGFIVEIVSLVLYYWLTVALVLMTIMELGHRHLSLVGSLRRGLPLTFPVVGVAVAFWVAAGLSALLLIIPGIAVAAIFYVAIPVLVTEKTGIVASLGRSMALTKGYRYQVFTIIWCIIFASAVVMILAWGAFRLLPLPIDENSPYFIGSYQRAVAFGALIRVALAFLSVVYPIIYAVTYCKLRALKEGLDVRHIAAQVDRRIE
jgi:hypothetical protein